MELDRVASLFRASLDEIGKVIIGQDATVRAILAGVFSQGHTLVIGVPEFVMNALAPSITNSRARSVGRPRCSGLELMPYWFTT